MAKTPNTADAYQIGYDIGVNSIEDLSAEAIPDGQMHAAFAGLLSAVLNALYETAPSRKAADDVVAFAMAGRK